MKKNLILIMLFLLIIGISQTAKKVGNYTMEVFDSQFYMKGQFANNLKGDMVIEYSKDGHRLFYGIRKNGNGFFDGEYIKEINLTDKYRYESKNIFVSFNDSNDNVQYLFSYGSYDSVSELYDFQENFTYMTASTQNILGNRVDSYVNSLLELKNDKNEYVLAYIFNQIYYLQKIAFSSSSLTDMSDITIKKVATYPNCSNRTNNRMIDGTILNQECILVLFINTDNFYINIFDFDLVLKFNSQFDGITGYEENNDGHNGLFAKSINLKDYYVLFIYFTEKDSYLKLKLGKFTKDSGDSFESFQPILNVTTNYIFKSNPFLNEVIKVNSQRCAYFGFRSTYNPNIEYVGNITETILILLIDMYNSYQDIKIREYNVTIESYKFHKDITAGIYNNYLCFSVMVYKDRPKQDELVSLLMMIGYLNDTNIGNNYTINIYDYFSNEDNNNIVIEIISGLNVENIEIENNIFGYEISKENIRLVEIPEEIEFYNKNNDTKLGNGDILNKNYLLKEGGTRVETQGNYYFEYQIIVQEPDYDIFNTKAESISDFHHVTGNSIDQKNYFEPQQFYGKVFSVNFTLCPDFYFFNSASNECQRIIVTTEYITETPLITEVKTTYIKEETTIITEAQTTYIKEETQPITEKQTTYILETQPVTEIETSQYTIQSISNDICSYEKLLDNNCIFETNNNSNLYDQIANNFIQSYPDNGESVVVKADDNHIFQITTLENELSSLNGNGTSNISVIDLGDCGDLLKSHYNISKDQDLIFLKYEKITEIASERNIQYEIYHPVHKYKLNISICESTSISIYVPVNLPEEAKQKYEELEKQGYDLFDPNSSFYQDICSPFESEDGTDVPLNDRKNDYYKNYNNNTQCQGNCQYSDYLSNSNYLKCECNVDSDNSIETNDDEEVKFENSMIYEGFYDILKNSNYKVVKCFNLVFNKEIFFHNYGSLLVIIYFLFFSAFFVFFIITGINPLKINTAKSIAEKQILKGRNSILFSSLKFNNLMDNNENKSNINNNSSYKKIKKESLEPPKKSTKTLDHHTKNIKRNSILNYNINNNKKEHNQRKSKYKNVVLLNNKVNIVNNNNNNNNKINENKINEILPTNKKQSSKTLIIDHKRKSALISNKKTIKEDNEENEEKNLDDFQLNNLEYLEAIDLDQRNFIQTYWSILKREHIIIFTFFIRNDYNLVHIKFSRFFFLICTDMAMNVIFFTDDSMHKVYKNYGKYDFLEQIPQIIYSTAVSQVLELILCYLSLTDKHLYQIKEIKNIQRKMDVVFQILRCVKFKLAGFYIFTFIFFVFYWYLVASFCAVYQNTQIIFIKDSISSFLIGLLYPFILYLFPALLRYIALKDRNKKRLKVIYKISDVIPIF